MLCLLVKILATATLGVVFMGAATTTTRAYEIAKPGCLDNCGGVQIPYPFGIGEGCYSTDMYSFTGMYYLPGDIYRINCSNVTNPPVPSIVITNTTKWEVLSISLEDHSIRVSAGVTYKCYNITSDLGVDGVLYLSNDRNKLIAVGCDTGAAVFNENLVRSEPNFECKPKFECNTSCIDLKDGRADTCDSKQGCCEAFLGDLCRPSIQLGSNSSRHSQVYCNYAFVSEAGGYTFSTSALSATSTDCDQIRVPVLYTWSLESPVCGSNAYRNAHDHCKCNLGYTGNPYLPQSCQDTNECADKNLNDCHISEVCENIDGGYICRCPDAHHRKGTTGSSCIVGDDTAGDEIAKAGCQSECGGVQIPFPFGIGAGCFPQDMPEFEIKCDPANPKPLLAFLENREVLTITIEDHTFRLSNGVAYEYLTNNTGPYTLDNTDAFNISATRNKFVAIGCVANALLTDLNRETNASGCSTSCTDVSYDRGDVDMTCNSVLGCCEASIFRNLSSTSIYFDASSDPKHHSGWCIYAFVAESGSYNFSATNLTLGQSECASLRFPVAYDWHVLTPDYSSSIPDSNNDYYRSSFNVTTLLCGANTHIEFDDGDFNGYICKCVEGFHGNPYLPRGCRDMNECLDASLNDCQRLDFCVNKDGGYDCRCPKGHLGNGTTSSPCIRTPGYHNIILGLGISMCLLIGFILTYGLYKLLKRR